MKRRDFVATTTLGSMGLGLGTAAAAQPVSKRSKSRNGRKIVVFGGRMDPSFLQYIIDLTGKSKPRMCFLPTASADSERSYIYWYQRMAGLDAVPMVQEMFISSYSTARSWEEILLSMDAIVVGGGNTLNMMAIWKAQGVDKVLRKAWDQGIVLAGGSAGSLCWFEEGTTDSRPRELTKIECLGFLKGSHSPHYDGESQRRPTYHKLISDGTLKPGYAIDNNAAIYFNDNEVAEVIACDDNSYAYYVDLTGGDIKETKLKPGQVFQ